MPVISRFLGITIDLLYQSELATNWQIYRQQENPESIKSVE